MTANASRPYADFYPTRGPRARRLARVEPVLWNPVLSTLDAAQAKRYADDGLLVLPQVLSQEQAEAVARHAEELRRDPQGFAPEEIVQEPGAGQVRSLFAVHRRSAVLEGIARHPLLLALARDVLGSEVYLHQSRINYKPAFDGQPFQWHSDFETWHAEDGMPRMRAVSVALALTENTQHNGPLMLIPGSHQHFLACAGATPDQHYRRSLRAQQYGTPDRRLLRALAKRGGIVAPTGNAGMAIAFDCNTLHGSAGNLSPWPRVNLFLVYNSIENRLRQPYAARTPRPEWLAARQYAPVLQAA